MFDRLFGRHELLAENAQLRDQVALLTRERDATLSPAFDGSTSDDPQFLFVVTYGRSGSTLLMGLLNSLPGYCIRGENQGVVYDLFHYQQKVDKARTSHTKNRPLTPQDAWYGIDEYPDDIAFARMRKLVGDSLLRPPAGTRVTGFKEIRWWMPHPIEYLDFIEAVFPGARFVLNTRNLDDVARSGWNRKHSGARADLGNVERRLRETISRRGDRAYHVHYDDYVADPSILRGLWEWLGEDFDLDHVAKILGRKHSTSRRWKSDAVQMT